MADNFKWVYSMCLVTWYTLWLTREWKVNLLHFISHPTLLEKNHNNRIIFWTKINVTVLGLKKINQQLSKVYSSISLQVKPVWCYYLSATSSNIWFRNVLHCWFWVHGLLLGWDTGQHNGTRRLMRHNIPAGSLSWTTVLSTPRGSSPFKLSCPGAGHTRRCRLLRRYFLPSSPCTT